MVSLYQKLLINKRREIMQVIESLWLSKYIKILENNKKTPEEIIKLKKI